MYPGERFNSISHLAGALLATAGTAVLVTLAARLGDAWKVVAFSVYGAMLVALYAASTATTACAGAPSRTCCKSWTTAASTC